MKKVWLLVLTIIAVGCGPTRHSVSNNTYKDDQFIQHWTVLDVVSFEDTPEAISAN